MTQLLLSLLHNIPWETWYDWARVQQEGWVMTTSGQERVFCWVSAP